MANVIFYFTGTGNSLTVARDLAAKLGDTELIPIRDGMSEESMDTDYERIGFVFPVYFVNVPAIVRRFINKLTLKGSKYVFCVATCGGSYGTTFSQMQKLVAAGGGTLHAGFSVGMPGNYIVKYGAYPLALQDWILRRGQKKIAGIAETVREKRAVRIPGVSIISARMENTYKKITENVGNMAGNFHATGQCNGCGTCQKLCPVNNRSISEKRPAWGNRCEMCVACIQWCPNRAIEYGDKTQKRKRYRHPGVDAASLIKMNGR